MSFQDDRGGNGVQVTGGLCGGNLHGVWDSCIIERGLGTDAAGHRRPAQGQDHRSAAVRIWLASSPADWANELFAITTGPGVGYCVRTDSGCWYDRDSERLEAGQQQKNVLVN